MAHDASAIDRRSERSGLHPAVTTQFCEWYHLSRPIEAPGNVGWNWNPVMRDSTLDRLPPDLHRETEKRKPSSDEKAVCLKQSEPASIKYFLTYCSRQSTGTLAGQLSQINQLLAISHPLLPSYLLTAHHVLESRSFISGQLLGKYSSITCQTLPEH